MTSYDLVTSVTADDVAVAGSMRLLTCGLSEELWLLMTTADTDDPARHIYANQGWQVIGPGLRDGQVVMGRRRV